MSTTAAPATASAAEAQYGPPPKESNRGAQIRSYLGLALIVIWGLAPFYWMIVTAFRDVNYTYDTSLWPTHVTLDNFKSAFSTSKGDHFARALGNSVLISTVTTILALAVGVFAAYALTRLQFPGKYTILGVILGASMFPGVALVTPLFQLFSDLGWLSATGGYNYQTLILPDISFALPLAVYTLTAFFGELPWDLEEAAKIDGATPGQAFRLVMLPLAIPGLFTTAILTFIAAWNEFLLASQLSTDKTKPVTVAIATFGGSEAHVEPYTTIMAAGTIVTVPLIIMVLVFQRAIVSGLTAGGVKG